MKNAYDIRGDVTAIFLNSRKYGPMETIIATSDLDRVKAFPGTWYPKNIQGYIYVHGNLPQKDKNQKIIKLHRWILNITDPKLHVDHVMHDTLDNCRWVLNVVTSAENQQNARIKSNNKSGYSGVKWNKQVRKWEVNLDVNRKRKYLGLYANLDDAISARKEAEFTFYGYKTDLLRGISE